MLSFSKVVIDPGHGYCDPSGKYDPGVMCGRLHEVSLIDEIVEELTAVFLAENIPYDLLATRKTPGMTPEVRGLLSAESARTLQVSIHFGQAKQMAHNGGHVYIKGPASHPLGPILGDLMTRWGQVTCKAYAGVKVCQARFEWLPPHDEEQGIMGLQIEPFCLNGIDSIIYAARLRRLGSDIGENLVSYLRSQNPALGVKRTQIWGNGPDGREVFGG